MNENVKVVFGLIGGLALFLYGMNSMSDALQKAAGEKMKKILEFLTKNPIMGALAGALVTAVLQSSSATTVMVIGFVSAGLMSLPQAISVIFGANIGTTMTAQLMAFKISDYIYPLIFIGFMLNFLGKKEKVKNIGMVIFSFGLLFEGIEGNDNGAQDLVGRAVQETNRMLGVDESLQQIASLLQDVESLLSDVNREVSDYVESMTFSEEEFYETEQRLNLLNRMKAKYGSTVEEILTCQEEKQKDLDRLYHFEQYKEKLEKEMQKAETELASVCEELSELRKVYGKQLEGRIIQGLQDLNFLDVKFEIDFETTEHYTANGNDKICFTISTNPGEPLRPLAKVVSGGELSRIMLAIKTILADKDETETLIFDEIDTGISGRTAQKVSEKMAVIGRNHQVICITHLPQIAAMADEHFEIAKKTDHQITRTQIRLLNEEDSALEIARILGGAQITEHTMESAKEMKELARKKKEEI